MSELAGELRNVVTTLRLDMRKESQEPSLMQD